MVKLLTFYKTNEQMTKCQTNLGGGEKIQYNYTSILLHNKLTPNLQTYNSNHFTCCQLCNLGRVLWGQPTCSAQHQPGVVSAGVDLTWLVSQCWLSAGSSVKAVLWGLGFLSTSPLHVGRLRFLRMAVPAQSNFLHSEWLPRECKCRSYQAFLRLGPRTDTAFLQPYSVGYNRSQGHHIAPNCLGIVRVLRER